MKKFSEPVTSLRNDKVKIWVFVSIRIDISAHVHLLVHALNPVPILYKTSRVGESESLQVLTY